MERRHQVFISSTFSDLVAERAEIIKALLELDCIPAGMEMFPATNHGAWELIQGVIDDSDYYCLVIGGRYGSQDEDGVGFTEKEYDYARLKGKPLMAFLHKDISCIPSKFTEQTEVGKNKLVEFRKKVESAHHCKYWASADELGGQVSRGLISLRKSNPSEGWVPGSYAMDEDARIEVANLRAKVAELEAELEKKKSSAFSFNTDQLASGPELFTATITFSLEKRGKMKEEIGVSWDTILKYVGPALIPECSDEDFLKKLQLCYYHQISIKYEDDTVDYDSVIIPYVMDDQIKVQLRALGQMMPGTKRRAVSDKKTYWKITPLGEERLLTVQALPKSKLSQPTA